MTGKALLSFEFDRSTAKLNIDFNREGAQLLIRALEGALKDGNHVHQFVGEPNGRLTRLRHSADVSATKALEVQYNLADGTEEWS